MPRRMHAGGHAPAICFGDSRAESRSRTSGRPGQCPLTLSVSGASGAGLYRECRVETARPAEFSWSPAGTDERKAFSCLEMERHKNLATAMGPDLSLGRPRPVESTWTSVRRELPQGSSQAFAPSTRRWRRQRTNAQRASSWVCLFRTTYYRHDTTDTRRCPGHPGIRD
jgi:hypothetical protein